MILARVMPLLPFVGAVVTGLLWSRPGLAGWSAGAAVGLTLAGVLAGLDGRDPVSSFFLVLFAVAALAAIGGGQRRRDAAVSHVTALLVLGFGAGSLVAASPLADLLLAGELVVLVVAVWGTSGVRDRLRVAALASLSGAALALLASLVAPGTASTTLRLAAYAVLLPLFPLHGGFVGALTSLPGTLPVLVVVVLPGLGWHGLATLLPGQPPAVGEGLQVLAIGGALLSVLRAGVQIHLIRLLASITVAFLAAAWWSLADGGSAAAGAWYVGAVSVAASGLLLGVHLLEMRYGICDVEKLGGLARTMPRFAALIGLLFMAAMGLPLFGVSSSFVGMLGSASFSLPGLLLVLLIWLLASLLLLKVWHRVFYGRPRRDLLYQDLTAAEVLPFAALIGLLLLTGQLPTETAPPPAPDTTAVTTTEAAR